MKIVLKLGGSLITNKNIIPTSIRDLKNNFQRYVKFSIIKNSVKDIFSFLQNTQNQLFIVHGAGHYGHFLIDQQRWKELGNIEIVHDYCVFLDKMIVKYFEKIGLKSKPLPPFETCYYDIVKKEFNIENLWDLTPKILKEGQLPISYGDIVPTKPNNSGKYEGFEVISGDDLVVLVARLWKADKIIMATNVDGIYDKNPEKYKDAKLFRKINPEQKISVSFDKSRIDVTGGIEEKVRKLQLVAKDGIKSQVLNALKRKNLENALKGDESIGTLISQ
jgi:isopentenyl phosphate kinase